MLKSLLRVAHCLYLIFYTSDISTPPSSALEISKLGFDTTVDNQNFKSVSCCYNWEKNIANSETCKEILWMKHFLYMYEIGHKQDKVCFDWCSKRSNIHWIYTNYLLLWLWMCFVRHTNANLITTHYIWWSVTIKLAHWHMVKNPMFHSCSKHIDIHYIIRYESVGEKKLKLRENSYRL